MKPVTKGLTQKISFFNESTTTLLIHFIRKLENSGFRLTGYNFREIHDHFDFCKNFLGADIDYVYSE